MSEEQQKQQTVHLQEDQLTGSDVTRFLDEVLNFEKNKDSQILVTLTFAQSVDGKIAGANGKQLILSCKESMYMTHLMRARHDAILVGIGTALNDNPQLNIRLLPPKDGQVAPVPVVLDSGLRLKTDSKLVQNFLSGNGRRPAIITKRGAHTDGWETRKGGLEAAGLLVLEIATKEGRLSLPDMLLKLQETGIRRLMVEGGATVISSFIGSGLVDRLITTVCPTLVGDDGVSYAVEKVPPLEFMRSQAVGKDTVMAWRG